jgi:hypothetical protein
MSLKRLTAEELRESIELGIDDSASDAEDEIELRIETENEEAEEVENYEEAKFSELNNKKLLIAVETGLADLVTPSSNNQL